MHWRPRRSYRAPAAGTVGKTTCRTRSPEWSKEKPEPASGAGGTTPPMGANVPVGLAGHNEVVRFTVVEQMTATRRMSVDLEGRPSPRTLKSGHTAIRADQFDPEGWRLPEEADSHQSNDQRIESMSLSANDHCQNRSRCTSDNDAPVTRRRKSPPQTSTDRNETAQPHTIDDPPSSSRPKK